MVVLDVQALETGGVASALVSRSAVDLKDKWRNLLRIAMLPVLYKRREAAEIPTEMLQRVRELANQKGGLGRNARHRLKSFESPTHASTSSPGPGPARCVRFRHAGLLCLLSVPARVMLR